MLLLVMPLVGWGMLSAARFPIAMFGSVDLFPVLPHNVMLYAFLRKTHRYLAYLLFFGFIAHFGAVLFHSLILRDGLFTRMARWRAPATKELIARDGPFNTDARLPSRVYERVATCLTFRVNNHNRRLPSPFGGTCRRNSFLRT